MSPAIDGDWDPDVREIIVDRLSSNLGVCLVLSSAEALEKEDDLCFVIFRLFLDDFE